MHGGGGGASLCFAGGCHHVQQMGIVTGWSRRQTCCKRGDGMQQTSCYQTAHSLCLVDSSPTPTSSFLRMGWVSSISICCRRRATSTGTHLCTCCRMETCGSLQTGTPSCWTTPQTQCFRTILPSLESPETTLVLVPVFFWLWMVTTLKQKCWFVEVPVSWLLEMSQLSILLLRLAAAWLSLLLLLLGLCLKCPFDETWEIW